MAAINDITIILSGKASNILAKSKEKEDFTHSKIGFQFIYRDLVNVGAAAPKDFGNY